MKGEELEEAEEAEEVVVEVSETEKTEGTKRGQMETGILIKEGEKGIVILEEEEDVEEGVEREIAIENPMKGTLR